MSVEAKDRQVFAEAPSLSIVLSLQRSEGSGGEKVQEEANH